MAPPARSVHTSPPARPASRPPPPQPPPHARASRTRNATRDNNPRYGRRPASRVANARWSHPDLRVASSRPQMRFRLGHFKSLSVINHFQAGRFKSLSTSSKNINPRGQEFALLPGAVSGEGTHGGHGRLGRGPRAASHSRWGCAALWMHSWPCGSSAAGTPRRQHRVMGSSEGKGRGAARANLPYTAAYCYGGKLRIAAGAGPRV